MSDTNTPDRANPDHNWIGDGMAASSDDVAAAVAHMKAWFQRELAALEARLKPTPTPVPSPVVKPVPVPGPVTSVTDTSVG